MTDGAVRNLGSAALVSTAQYSTEHRPEKTFTGPYGAKVSNCYLLRFTDKRSELGQIIFRRNGTWYGGLRLK